MPPFYPLTPIPESIKAKIDRAYEDIRNLSAEMAPFFRKHNYRLVQDSDLNATDPSFRIVEPVVVPAPSLDRFKVIAGEVIYHLRSGMDQLVWQLILRNGKNPEDFRPRPEFPIYRDRQKYETEGVRKIEGVSPFARAIIEESQPYPGRAGYASEALWNIHQLNNIDKHRLLNAVASFVNVKFRFEGAVHLATCRIEGRTVLFSGPPGCEMEMEAEQAFHVSLAESGILESESIISTLEFFADIVWSIICRFEPEFK